MKPFDTDSYDCHLHDTFKLNDNTLSSASHAVAKTAASLNTDVLKKLTKGNFPCHII